MKLIAFKPMIRGALRGFASVELPIGLIMGDVPVLVTHGRAWANLSAKPQLDKDGQTKRDANGKIADAAMLHWRDRELTDRFSNAVIELVREAGHRIDGEAP
jgi:hypothetical protein